MPRKNARPKAKADRRKLLDRMEARAAETWHYWLQPGPKTTPRQFKMRTGAFFAARRRATKDGEG